MLTTTATNLGHKLLSAVVDNDVSQAQSHLIEGADPNTRDTDTGMTVLMMAACQANPELVKLLIDSGADVFTTDAKTGATALHKACQGGSVEVARLLVEAGAFVDATMPTTGHTPIMEALWYKWPDLVRFLVEQGADLEYSTHYGFTMMEHFQFELNVNIIGKEKLLEIEKIFDDRRREIETTIAEQKVMVATNQGDAEAVKRLIAQNETVNTLHPNNCTFSNGHTPLLVAARDNHADIVRLLLDAGAEVRVEDWVFKGAPIHKATYNGNPEILKMLIEHPDIDIDVQGPINGYTPIHDALWHGYTECAEMLLEAGARLNLRGHDGKTPLDVAIDVYGEDSEMVHKIRAVDDQEDQ